MNFNLSGEDQSYKHDKGKQNNANLRCHSFFPFSV